MCWEHQTRKSKKSVKKILEKFQIFHVTCCCPRTGGCRRRGSYGWAVVVVRVGRGGGGVGGVGRRGDRGDGLGGLDTWSHLVYELWKAPKFVLRKTKTLWREILKTQFFFGIQIWNFSRKIFLTRFYFFVFDALSTSIFPFFFRWWLWYWDLVIFDTCEKNKKQNIILKKKSKKWFFERIPKNSIRRVPLLFLTRFSTKSEHGGSSQRSKTFNWQKVNMDFDRVTTTK